MGMHMGMHLGVIFQNIRMGKESYAVQALNEPLVDEIDRSSDAS